jgi:TRAP-type C4-dicarboxylate transport system substrate-binding protein
MTPRKIRWLIAHQPVELFVRTAEAFKQELNKRLPGHFDLEIITAPEYVEQYKGSKELATILDDDLENVDAAVDALFNALDDDIHLSQTQVIMIGAKDRAFYTLDLPFMFDDHAHVKRVVEGPIGEEICANLEKTTTVKGLAFTYSGGYRVIGSNQAIASLSDLQDKRVIVVGNKTPRTETLEAVGAETIAVNPLLWGGWDTIPTDGSAECVETTYLRSKVNHILKTNHSMFITTILTGKKFWATLSKEEQTAFEECAKITASIEREWAIADAAKFEADAEANGITITPLSEQDEVDMKHKARYTYLGFGAEYGDLIKRIRQS